MGRERSMKSGIGAYAVQLGELKVGAVVTLNALGDIYDIDTDKKIAGALDENGQLFDDETAYFEAAAKIQNMFTGNTTIGTIITNAKLDKTALNKVASIVSHGCHLVGRRRFNLCCISGQCTCRYQSGGANECLCHGEGHCQCS